MPTMKSSQLAPEKSSCVRPCRGWASSEAPFDPSDPFGRPACVDNSIDNDASPAELGRYR